MSTAEPLELRWTGDGLNIAGLAREFIADLPLRWVAGGHHSHMERSAPEIARHIGQFFTEED